MLAPLYMSGRALGLGDDHHNDARNLSKIIYDQNGYVQRQNNPPNGREMASGRYNPNLMLTSFAPSMG
jgi:hypothetical protein